MLEILIAEFYPMSLEYLAEIEHEIDSGRSMYACISHQGMEWFISDSLEDIRKRAKRTAATRRCATVVYRVVSKMDVAEGDSFLVVRKILAAGPKGEPHIHWIQVDTREAADMLRDVSQGPTPYFGVSIEENVLPSPEVKP